MCYMSCRQCYRIITLPHTYTRTRANTHTHTRTHTWANTGAHVHTQMHEDVCAHRAHNSGSDSIIAHKEMYHSPQCNCKLLQAYTHHFTCNDLPHTCNTHTCSTHTCNAYTCALVHQNTQVAHQKCNQFFIHNTCSPSFPHECPAKNAPPM